MFLSITTLIWNLNANIFTPPSLCLPLTAGVGGMRRGA